MEITFYGHACFGVKSRGKHLIFDPFITPNALAKNIDLKEIPADYILISHGHEDHIADVEQIALRTQATLISNFEIINWFAAKGIDGGHPMNIGGNKTFDFGRVKSVVALHSSVMPDGASGGNPGGFVVEGEKTFYYAGDTALTYDMKLIDEEFNLDFAMLPLGDNFTMGVNDALKCSDFIGCNNIVAMHYNTFPYIEIDIEKAKETFAKAGKTLHVIEIGQTIDI